MKEDGNNNQIRQSMKKSIYLAAAIVLATVSCQRDELVPEYNYSIKATREAGMDTKSTVSDAGSFLWVSGDAIGIYNGSSFNELTTTQSGASATFTGTVVGTPQTCAVFPYDIADTPSSVNLPDSYEWVANQANAPMYAEYDASGLAFKHLGGLIKVTVAGVPASATSFVFTADKDITGTYTINKDGENGEIKSQSAETGKSVTFTFAAAESAREMSFYVPVPVGSYKMAVALKNGETELWSFAGSTSNEITRAKLLIMPKLTITSIHGSGEGSVTSVSVPANYSGTYVLPETSKDVYVNMDATTNPVIITYKDNAEAKPANVFISCGSNVIGDLSVKLAESHVELSGSKYTTLTSITSLSTLVINQGTIVNKLSVCAGSVEVKGEVADIAISSTVENVAKVRISDEGKVTNSITNDSQAEIQKSSDNTTTIPTPSGSGNTAVATVNSDTANEIVKTLSEGGSVTLTDDLDLYEPVEIFGTTNLALGGFTVSAKHTDEFVFAVHNGATFNITGTGTIDGSNNVLAIKLTVKGDDPSSPAVLKIKGKSKSSPVYVKGDSYAISGNGNRANTDVNLNYVNVEALSGTAIYQPQPESNMVLNNVKGTAPNSVVEIRSGKANIYGFNTVLEATAAAFKAEKNGNGTTIEGAAIAVSQHTTNNPIEVSIGSGEYKGQCSVFFGDLQDDLNQDNTSVIIKEGTFDKIYHKNGKMSVMGGTFNQMIESDLGGVICGGTFNTKPDDRLLDMENLLYSATDNSSKWVYGSTMFTSFSVKGTYTFYKDVTTTKQLTYSTSSTIDLGGHTITSTYSSRSSCAFQNLYCSSATLTFKNGTLDVQGDCVAAINATYNTTIVLDDGFTLKTNCGGILLEYKPNPSTTRPIAGNGYLVMNEGASIINTGEFAAVQTNGSAGNKSHITINGGQISSANGAGIYKPDAGTLTISGGEISGQTAVYVKSGSTTITGGTFSGTGAQAEYSYNGNGCNLTGDAFVVDNCGYPGGVPVVSVTGGTFNSTNAAAIASYAGNGLSEIVKNFIAKTGVTLTPALDSTSELWAE